MNTDTLGYNGDMESGIYQITNQINGKRYIGSAVNLRHRWRDHLSALRRGKHENQYLQRAFDKYGELDFLFSILEHTELQSLIEREQHYLDTLSPEYNIAPIAGSQLGYRHSLEARRKMSESKKGERNYTYGKPLSEETRRKISVANLGKHHGEETRRKMREAWTPERRWAQNDRQRGKARSAETRAKISAALTGERNPNYGKPRSEETRRKISEARMGQRLSEETRLKISEARMGQQASAETCAKISAALSGARHPMYGKHHSDDTRAKMSEARKAYWRKRHALSDRKGGE